MDAFDPHNYLPDVNKFTDGIKFFHKLEKNFYV